MDGAVITALAVLGAWVGLAVIYYGTWTRLGRRIDESLIGVLVAHGDRLPGDAGSPERETAARRLVDRANVAWALLSPGGVLLVAWWVTR